MGAPIKGIHDANSHFAECPESWRRLTHIDKLGNIWAKKKIINIHIQIESASPMIASIIKQIAKVTIIKR